VSLNCTIIYALVCCPNILACCPNVCRRVGRKSGAGLRDCSSGIGNCPVRWSRSPALGSPAMYKNFTASAYWRGVYCSPAIYSHDV